QVSWLFVDLTERSWLVPWFRIVVFMGLLFLVGAEGGDLLRPATLRDLVPLGWAVMSLKLVVSIGLFYLLWRRGHVGATMIGGIVAGWLALVLGLVELVRWMLPAALISTGDLLL